MRTGERGLVVALAIVVLLGLAMFAVELGNSVYICGGFYLLGTLAIIRVDALEIFEKIQHRIRS